MQKRTVWGIILIVSALIGYIGLRMFAALYTDWLWFQNLNYSATFVTITLTKFGICFLFWAFFVVLSGCNIWVARFFGNRTREMPLEVIVGDALPSGLIRIKRQRLLWTGIVVTLGFFMGVSSIPVWTSALRYLHPVAFGIQDPIFGHDLSFYVFRLPVYSFTQGWLTVAVILSAILVFISYYHDRSIRNDEGNWITTPYVRAHLSVLSALFALVMAWRYRLKIFELLYSFRKDAFFGAGYTDTHLQIPAYWLMVILSVGLAGLLLYNLRSRGFLIPSVAGMVYMASVMLFSWFIPALYEQLRVKPNDLRLEPPYIQNCIDFTRKAYALDKVEEVPFPAESNLTYQDIQNNLTTVNSIPLWDRRPLMDTYRQLQEIRTYYSFNHVDVDRYHINGDYRQVMLAAREFSRAQTVTWVNRHLVYTHGYGLCMSPANEIASEGLPEFYVRDIPPVSPAGISINRPEIYYGEDMRNYVIVRAKTQEFDYPKGDENVYTTYQGKGGVPINSLFRRLFFALRFSDPYLMVTNDLTPESRVLFDRHIGRRFGDEVPRRFHKLAPFLRFDQDPYLAVAEGRLVWIQDAYTATNMYPYSEPYGRPYIREMNYIRNSVKAVLDAYDGTVTFYVWDTEDPLIRSYMKIFPDLFQPKEAMPQAVRAHVRYPTDLFQIQASMYNTYHMMSPNVFYNREDVWDAASELYGMSERPRQMTPYYVIVRLPDSDREEFVLLLPAVPAGKDNMIAWLFARCDAPNYGRLIVYKLPKDKLIYGPMLIERRIDQDTEVSREITLWSQRGSDVIRGNLLVIPIEKSFIYVEPLYLRATQSGMPELKRVLVVHGEKLAMGKNLNSALAQVFSSTMGIDPEPAGVEASRSEAPSSSQKEALARSALKYLNDAQDSLRTGNFAGYGKAIQQLRDILTQINRRQSDGK